MVLPQLALTLLALVLCAFAPGFFLVRRLRWKPIEKLCGAVGVSLVATWFAAWIVYLVAPGAGSIGAAAIVGGAAVLLALSWPDAVKLFGDGRARRTSLAMCGLMLVSLFMLAAIRHISGAGWTGDWLEHFQRTLVYVNHVSKDVPIFGGYRLASRPPLAHVIAAMLMGLGGERFEVYQLVFDFLGLLIFLPCALMLPQISRPWKSGVMPLAGMFAMSPMVMVNATYPGTKPLAGLFVVLAMAFYLRAWRKPDSGRMAMAFLAAAGGVLAHYSALPYAVFLGLHYLIAVFPRRHNRWCELGILAGMTAAPLAAWFAWCFGSFGVQGTLSAMANTSFAYGQTYQGSYLMKSLANLLDSIVPHVLRGAWLVQAWGQPNTLGYVRDNAFIVYQTSLIFTMGCIGGPLAIWWLVRALRRRGGGKRTFWLALIPYSVAACFALVGERDHYGVAHITMYAMLAIGLTLAAGNFTRSRAISLLIVAGCAVDFSLGVFLQARVEHMENTASQVAFPRIMVGTVRMDLAPAGENALSRTSGSNWFRKHQYALAEKWLSALSGAQNLPPGQASARDALREVIRQDETMFAGWYRRHGGELTFIGDHFGESDASCILLAAAGIVVLFGLSRIRPPAPVVSSTAPRQGRSGPNRASARA